MKIQKPSIEDLTLMQHDHTGASSGGILPGFADKADLIVGMTDADTLAVLGASSNGQYETKKVYYVGTESELTTALAESGEITITLTNDISYSSNTITFGCSKVQILGGYQLTFAGSSTILDMIATQDVEITFICKTIDGGAAGLGFHHNNSGITITLNILSVNANMLNFNSGTDENFIINVQSYNTTAYVSPIINGANTIFNKTNWYSEETWGYTASNGVSVTTSGTPGIIQLGGTLIQHTTISGGISGGHGKNLYLGTTGDYLGSFAIEAEAITLETQIGGSINFNAQSTIGLSSSVYTQYCTGAITLNNAVSGYNALYAVSGQTLLQGGTSGTSLSLVSGYSKWNTATDTYIEMPTNVINLRASSTNYVNMTPGAKSFVFGSNTITQLATNTTLTLPMLYTSDLSGSYTTRTLVDQGYVLGLVSSFVSGTTSTDNSIVRYNGTGGTAIQSSLVIVDDDGTIHSPYFTNSASGASSAFHSVEQTETNTVRGYLAGQHNDGTSAARFIGRKSRGTYSSPTAVQNNDGIFRYAASAHDGTSYIDNIAFIEVKVSGTVSTGVIPTEINFRTTGVTGTAVTALRITNNQVLKYNSDVSANFDTLSLINKGYADLNYSKPTLNKTITYETPTSSDNITIFRTDVDITVQEVISVSTGSSASTTYQLFHDPDRGATGNTLTTSTITAGTTAGDTATLSDATIPANSWIWLETTGATGTNVSLTIDIRYIED